MTMELDPKDNLGIAALALMEEPRKYTLDEIAAWAGVSPQWISAIEQKALRKMLQAANKRGLTDALPAISSPRAWPPPPAQSSETESTGRRNQRDTDFTSSPVA